MMNDRFDAQLRQHLVGSADERQAEGQLAGLVEALAGTPQHRPFLARLTWFPGRLGSAQSAALRYGLVVLALVAAGVAVLLFAAASKPPRNTVVVPPSNGPVSSLPATAQATQMAPPSADPQCIQFDSEWTYTANAGTLPVSLTVPQSASAPWSGSRDEFLMTQAACGSSGSLTFRADLVARVYADACHWGSSTIEAPTAFDAAAALAKQTGHDTVVPTESKLGPFRATRLDVSVPSGFDTAACDGGFVKLWGDQRIDPGMTVQVYVAEVDGVTLVVTASYATADATPTLLGEIDAARVTLRVDM